MEQKELYYFEGSVMHFDKLVASSWKASTMAVSKKKAMANLKYRYATENNMASTNGIRLIGSVEKGS